MSIEAHTAAAEHHDRAATEHRAAAKCLGSNDAKAAPGLSAKAHEASNKASECSTKAQTMTQAKAQHA